MVTAPLRDEHNDCGRSFMATFGTARRIDALGRVVLPADLRKVLSLASGDLLAIEVNGEQIVLRKAWEQCVFCDSLDGLVEYREKMVCRSCVETIAVPATAAAV